MMIPLPRPAVAVSLLLSLVACSGGVSSPSSPGGSNPPPKTAAGSLDLKVPPSWTSTSLVQDMVATNDGVYIHYTDLSGSQEFVAKFSLSENLWREQSYKKNSIEGFAPESLDNDVGAFRYSVLIKQADLPFSTVPVGVGIFVIHTAGHFSSAHDSPIRSTTEKAREVNAMALSGGALPRAWVRDRYFLASETGSSNAQGAFWDFHKGVTLTPIKTSVVAQRQGRIVGDPDGPYLWAATKTGMARIVTVGADTSWTLPAGNGLGFNSKIVVVSDANESQGYSEEVWADFAGWLYVYDGATWTQVYDLDLSGGSVLHRSFGVGPHRVYLASGVCIDRTPPFAAYDYLRAPDVADPSYAEWMQKKIQMGSALHSAAHPEQDRVYFATRDGVMVVTPMSSPTPVQ